MEPWDWRCLTAFWWLTLWLLLSGRVAWRKLLPSAIATALFWIGMEVVFSYIFSSTIITDYNKYGPIGVVFALMSWLIAIGVVIILGAVAGIVWDEERALTGRPIQGAQTAPNTSSPVGHLSPDLLDGRGF